MIAGSIERIDPLDDTALTAGDGTVEFNNHVRATFEGVTCPSGAPYDFPVPRTDDPDPSHRIRHVILVIRENKTYDALFGDYAGPPGDPADGDPDLTLVPRDQMATVFPNIRALADAFAIGDNFYSNAELSHQGHGWTTAGRTTDSTERMRLQTDRRGTRPTQLTGLAPIGNPEEGDIFSAMTRAGITTEDWGEIVGLATTSQRAVTRYPGSFWNTTFADIVKASAFTDFVQGRNIYGMNRRIAAHWSTSPTSSSRTITPPEARRVTDAAELLRRQRRGHGLSHRRRIALELLARDARRGHRRRSRGAAAIMSTRTARSCCWRHRGSGADTFRTHTATSRRCTTPSSGSSASRHTTH